MRDQKLNPIQRKRIVISFDGEGGIFLFNEIDELTTSGSKSREKLPFSLK